MKINNIVLFCPSKITGGYEYLSIRLADALLRCYPQFNVYYCDYPDGFSHTSWYSDSVKYIDYIGKDVPISIPAHSIVIAQLNIISEPERLIIDQDNSYIIYWFLHSLNIKGQIFARGHYYVTKKERKCLGRLLRKLSELDAVKCMSYGAYVAMIRDCFQEPKVFSWLPNIAPVDYSPEEPSFSRISENELKFCWLGRLDQEKAINILTYMNELEEISKSYSLSLSIIGNGPAEDMLRKKSSDYSYTISFVGEKRNDELDRFIREETEIGLASGTSAFEFSLRGKPVIMEWVIDRVYEAGVRKRYMFTEEDEDYDYSSGFELRRNGEASFSDKLNEILNNYEGVSRKGYDFVMNKSANNCAKKLIECIGSIERENPREVANYEKKVAEIINKGRRRLLWLAKIKSIFYRKKS